MSLARFHGLTAALYQKDSQLIERVGKSWSFHENESEESKRYNKQFTKSSLTEMCKTVESLGCARYAEIIRGKIDSVYETLQKQFKPSGELKVLNHGDCWSANVLFKYDDFNEVVDAKLVDFQMIRVGTFAQDVIKFWWSSTRQDVRESLQQEIFEVYRKNAEPNIGGGTGVGENFKGRF